MKLRTGDTVVIISGKDKGKTGTILTLFPEDVRVVVAGANLRTRHIRKTPQQPGRIIRYEASLHASNVMLIDPKTKKRTRAGFRIDEKGRKVRVSTVSGEEIVKVRAQKAKAAPAAQPSKAPEREAATQKETVAAPAPVKAKKPFWKKMGFGAEALADAEVHEGSRMQQDHSIPAQEQHVRAGSRGS